MRCYCGKLLYKDMNSATGPGESLDETVMFGASEESAKAV